MSGRKPQSAAALAGLIAVLVVLVAVSAAVAAGPSRKAVARANVLRARVHHAVLDLYALDTRLQRAETRLTSLEAQTAQLHARQALLAQRLAAARRTLEISRQRLGDNLRTLYEQGDSDAFAVVLGAQSLDDAVTRLDDMSRIAEQSRQVVVAASSAQIRLARVRAMLATEGAQLTVTLASARRTAHDRIAARDQRLAFITRLRDRQRLQARQIAALQLAAWQAETKSNKLQAAAEASAPADGDLASSATPSSPTRSSDPGSSDPGSGDPGSGDPGVGGRTITVISTGYALKGRTATGIPVGWGVIAVDPSTIPLGTRLTIPGYGEGVAADTGSAVHGSVVDLWFPSLAQARAWGRRTVTITLH